MTYIPSSEIKQPSLHADTLGFTFVWRGHFLRGIFPQSLLWAKSFFESGFIKEITKKGLFPNTWISSFENEQFGLIIEHEMISPLLYATEWNSAMLKDAALMVLKIAQIGWKYGYNMVDCHKLNVMFKNNRPLYVDLGSFVPREDGSTGWKPYRNFMESYSYILDLWTHGSEHIAKRMMSPGVCLLTDEYLAYKHPFYRKMPKLLRLRIHLSQRMNLVAILGRNHFEKSLLQKALKEISRVLKLGISQHIRHMRRTIEQADIHSFGINETKNSFDYAFLLPEKDMTCVNVCNVEIIKSLSNGRRIISINENNSNSNLEYQQLKNITSVSFPLLNGGVLIRGKFPEARLKSEVVLARCVEGGHGQFSKHNSIVFLEQCMTYSSCQKMYIWLSRPDPEMTELINERFAIEGVSKDQTLLFVQRRLL